MTKTNMAWKNRRWWIRSLLAEKIVCLSYSQQEVLYKKTIFNRRTEVIHIGIDLALFDYKQENRTQVREQLGIAQSNVVLGCVAHLVRLKGHPELIDALKQISEEYPDIKIVLIGGGEKEYRQRLESLVEQASLSDRVILLGLRDDVHSLMSAFDGLVLPTRGWGMESFGTVIVEAMACGLPVIATRSVGPEDIVVDRETGWLVSAEGVQPLVDAISEFAGNAELRIAYGSAGQKRAHKLFSREKMVRRYESLYLEVARS